MPTIPQPPIRARDIREGAFQISWFDFFLTAALILVCFFAGIAAIGLTGPDEPRYAAIARSMARTGDWITPRLNGQPWFEKPILYYWLAGLSFRVFGDGEFAMRLPSILAAILATLATGWAAFRAFGLDSARFTLRMMPVTIGLIGFSHSAAGDMLFAAFLAAAAAAAYEILRKAESGASAKIAFGVVLGGATLAKGPAAVLLAGGSLLLWSLASRHITAAFRFFHPMCLLAFALTAVPWYALCAARNPEFFHVFFVEHNVQRYLTPIFQHPQPFWFFVPVLLASVFPWTILVVPLILDAARSAKTGDWRDSPALYFGCWVIAPLLFFSFSESKLPGYILPATPPLVLLLACTLSRRATQTDGGTRTWMGLVGVSFPLLALSARYGLRLLPGDSGPASFSAWVPVILVAASGGLICAVLAWRRRGRAAVAAVAILMAALVATATATVSSKLDPYLSARDAARVTLEHTRPADIVSVLAVDRSLQFGLEYYLDHTVPEWTEAAPKPAWVWTTAAGFAALQRAGLNCVILAKISSEAWLLRIDPRTAS